MMKRFTKIALILGGILLGLGLILGMGGILLGAVGEIRDTRNVTVEWRELTVSPEEASGFRFSLTSEDVTVTLSGDENIHVRYAVSEERDYESGVSGGEWHFSRTGASQWRIYLGIYLGMWGAPDTVTVELPAGFDRPLTVETRSGEMEVSDVTAGVLDVSSTSGDVTLENVKCQTLLVGTVSGDMRILSAEAEGADLSATSGEIDAADCRFGTLTAETVSGDMELERMEVEGGADLSATSGEIELDGTVRGDVTATTVSGDVGITLSGQPRHRFETDTLSGIVETYGGDGSGAFVLSVSTTSGDIFLKD